MGKQERLTFAMGPTGVATTSHEVSLIITFLLFLLIRHVLSINQAGRFYLVMVSY